jgi:glycosyltransferase involved in cell wall biosynthesis
MTAHISNRPQSIVFLGTAHDNGGSSILASNLAAVMRADGHHVEEWYLFGSKRNETPGGARVFHNGPRVRSPLTLAALFVRLVAAFRSRKPDAVFGLQSLANLIAGVGGRLAGIRNRVPTYHIARERQNATLMLLDGIAGRLGFYTHMIACAKNVAETYTRNGAAYARQLMVIANGQKKPQSFGRAEARTALGLAADGPVIGQIGRFDYQKNQAFTLDLLRDLPSPTLLLVGSGPDEARVAAAIAAAELQSRVHVVDAIDHARIGIFYSAVDLALFPSRFEGLSLAAIEAIHASVPLVCSDIPSFREMFRNSPFLAETLLVPLGDREAWLNRVRAILSDKKLRLHIVAELRRLSPAYAFETMAAKYLSVID